MGVGVHGPFDSGTYPPAATYTVGKYSVPPSQFANVAPTQSRLRVMRRRIERRQKFDRIGSQVTTAAASSTLRWVVHAEVDGAPSGSPLLDTGAVGDSTATGFKEATIDLTLDRGFYWIGCVPQGGNPTLLSHSNVVAEEVGVTAAEIASLLGLVAGYYQDGVTGAAGAWATTGASASAPACFLRAATTP